ncbi:hypothetical protein EVAR_13012_1 [Eumeta japonica]|uniref:Uncharacterized protein n=1 Tax=Eumeta variegata TaxID=151549 RepID=A0A4C1TWX2_EUMVA|nr:hypothetical protein EVAR_13012_1 [Eumeta japonica]
MEHVTPKVNYRVYMRVKVLTVRLKRKRRPPAAGGSDSMAIDRRIIVTPDAPAPAGGQRVTYAEPAVKPAHESNERRPHRNGRIYVCTELSGCEFNSHFFSFFSFYPTGDTYPPQSYYVRLRDLDLEASTLAQRALGTANGRRLIVLPDARIE